MDRLSMLPDEILLHILSFLPTVDAVATSILSPRYANLWTSLPVIDLKTYEDSEPQRPKFAKFDALPFVNFVNKLLIVNTSPTIRKFLLHTKKFDDRNLLCINGWIRLLFSTKNIIELDLDIVLFFSYGYNDDHDDFMCLRLPSCDSLEVLKFSANTGLVMAISDCCFRNLRVFHLQFHESNLYRELAANLFPNLPRLEELVIKAHLTSNMSFNIESPSLKTFSMSIDNVIRVEMDIKVVIDAPLLEQLCLDDDGIAFYSVKNLSSISEAKVSIAERIGVYYYTYIDIYKLTYISRAVKLLRGVSNAKSLSLSGRTVLALVCSFQKNLPAFPLLTKLELFIPYASCCRLLFPLLANAPYLEVLVVALRENAAGESDIVESEAMLADSIGSFVFCPPNVLPTCLLRLHEIEFRGLEKKEEFKLLKFIVENGEVLKNISVNSVKRK